MGLVLALLFIGFLILGKLVSLVEQNWDIVSAQLCHTNNTGFFDAVFLHFYTSLIFRVIRCKGITAWHKDYFKVKAFEPQ